jgi:KDO2-lipid IV(A) lauroyltransferase
MYVVLSAAGYLLAKIGDKGQEFTAQLLALLAFDVFRFRRKLILRNIGIAFPEMPFNDRIRTGRASLYHFFLSIVEFLASRHTDITRRVTVKNPELAQEILSRGQGMYAVVSHMGNWEAFGAAMTRKVRRSHVIVKRVGGESTNRFVEETRRKNDFVTVKRTRKGDGFIAIRDALAANEIVGFVMDQARPGEPKLPFFGVPAKTNTSLAAIWRRCPAPMIPAFIHRIPGSRDMQIEFMPEITLTVSADASSDILDHSTRLNAAVESIIRRFPDQYFWLHARWK